MSVEQAQEFWDLSNFQKRSKSTRKLVHFRLRWQKFSVRLAKHSGEQYSYKKTILLKLKIEN
jgi:hypothetical protein